MSPFQCRYFNVYFILLRQFIWRTDETRDDIKWHCVKWEKSVSAQDKEQMRERICNFCINCSSITKSLKPNAHLNSLRNCFGREHNKNAAIATNHYNAPKNSRQSSEEIVHAGILLRHCNHPFRYAFGSSRAPWALCVWRATTAAAATTAAPSLKVLIFTSQKQFPIASIISIAWHES